MARRIEALRADGWTRARIASETGIGERTQRKLISGETPGSRLFARQMAGTSKVPKGSREAGRVVVVVERPDGTRGYVNMVLPEYARAKRITPLDRVIIAKSEPVQEAVVEQLTETRTGVGSAPWTQEEAEDAKIVAVYAKGHTKQSNVPTVFL